jgi:Flp pilus assembly protein protease CpaA
MSLGASLFLFGVGAILRFAVTATVAGIDIKTVGTILMIIGVIGFAISLWIYLAGRRAGPGSPPPPSTTYY